MTTLETLKAARELITPKRAWTTGTLAKTSPEGKRVDYFSVDAKCWCSSGAIMRVNPQFNGWNYLLDAMKTSTIPIFNDTHTHAEVLAAFDEAIARLEAK
jgi:hypothetical protein